MLVPFTMFYDALDNIRTMHRIDTCKSLSIPSTDTRTLQTGQAFFALPGPHFNVFDFSRQLLEKSPSLIVCDRPPPALIQHSSIPVIVVDDAIRALGTLAACWRQLCPTKIIAITGSAGKTTTKEILAEVLSKSFSVHKTAKNENNRIGLPKTLFNMAPEHDWAILELGTNIPGEIAALTEICTPDYACIVNIGAAHLENFGSLAGVAKEKSALFNALSKNNCAIINVDDTRVFAASSNIRARTLSYSRTGKAATVSLQSSEEIEPSKLRLSLNVDQKPSELCVPNNFGDGFIYATLVALTLSHDIGIPLSQVEAALIAFKGIQGRFALHSLSTNITLIDDSYNANPLSMEMSLQTVAKHYPNTQRIAVLGDMLELGETASDAHTAIGLLAAKLDYDVVISVGSYGTILADAFARASAKPSHYFEKLETDAIPHCIETLVDRDKDVVILLKGSRGVALENLIEPLRKKFAKHASPHSQ